MGSNAWCPSAWPARNPVGTYTPCIVERFRSLIIGQLNKLCPKQRAIKVRRKCSSGIQVLHQGFREIHSSDLLRHCALEPSIFSSKTGVGYFHCSFSTVIQGSAHSKIFKRCLVAFSPLKGTCLHLLYWHLSIPDLFTGASLTTAQQMSLSSFCNGIPYLERKEMLMGGKAQRSKSSPENPVSWSGGIHTESCQKLMSIIRRHSYTSLSAAWGFL